MYTPFHFPFFSLTGGTLYAHNGWDGGRRIGYATVLFLLVCVSRNEKLGKL